MSKNCTGMTDEAQRIAIAEACGWTYSEADHGDNNAAKKYKWGSDLPDYLNDLNAMHEAEKWLTDGRYYVDDYWDHLSDLCGHDEPGMIMATARQRAEAFLRTIGKWEDEG